MENKRYKILLIEDDEIDRAAFERLVRDQQLPYRCAIADSVSDAKIKLADEQFDIVIADYSLPDGTGLDVLDSVKDTPFILATGVGDEEIAIKAWRAGACDYLIKDAERNYLKAVPMIVENAVRRKKTEAKLQLLSAAITSTDDSVYIADMNNKIIFVNKAFCETYQYSEEEIIGKDSNILWIGKLQSQSTRSVFQVAGSTSQVGFYHKRKNDSIFPVSLSRSAIKDEKGREIAVVGVVRDISERIQVEDEFRAANLRLEERNRLKSELAAMISDALRTLSASLKDVIQDTTAADVGVIRPKLREDLQLASENTDKVAGFAGDLRDISQINVDKTQLEQTKLRLQLEVSQLIESLSPVIAGKKD